MNDLPLEYQLIARELAGDATAEEHAQLEAWIAADPEHLRTFTVLRRAWTLSGGADDASRFDADADWPAVLARIDRLRAAATTQEAAGAPPGAAPLGRRAWASRAAVRAAAIAALLLAPWLAWRLAHRAPHAPALAELSTPRGGTREAVLPDGSRVRLGAESSIRYAAAFNGPTRTIELRGMAYFDVVHDPARPFLVRVRDGITARDVGTRFVVSAYPESPRVEVAVAQGRVALGNAKTAAAEVAIGAGEVGEVGADGVPSVAKDASPDSHFAWLRGVLVLHDRPLTEALAALGRWYDVQLKVDDPRLAARRISTTAGDIPLADALEKITLALGAHREQRGDTTVVVP